MRNIPVDLSSYRLMVSEEPAMKMRTDDGGLQEAAVDRRTGAVQYAVAVFVKASGERGEEIRVTLPSDPGDGFAEGVWVELVSPTVSAYKMPGRDGKEMSGISWRAEGLKPARPKAKSAAA